MTAANIVDDVHIYHGTSVQN